MHVPEPVAVCRSVLNCIAALRSVLQCVAVCCSVLQCFVVCYSVLCSVLQYRPVMHVSEPVAVCFGVL